MTTHGLLGEVESKKKLYKNIFRRREYDTDYNREEVESIKQVLYNPNNISSLDLINVKKEVVLYGSSVFKGNVLSSDIDSMQLLPVYEHAKAMQWVISRLFNKRYEKFGKYFLGDIKCGLVSEFRSLSQYIGYYDLKKKKIIGYDYNAVKYGLSKVSHNLIIPQKIESKQDMINYFKINDYVHEIITRRWTPEDIMKGLQQEANGSEYTLEMACLDSELTKLDLYYYGNTFYKEITNVFIEPDQAKDNVSFDNGLILNMLIQYYVKDKKMKALKRLYAYTRMNKQIDITLKLHDFTQRSLAGKYNNIVSNLKVLNFIFENHWDEMISQTNKQVWKNLLDNTTYITQFIQKLYDPYDKFLKSMVDEYYYEVVAFVVELYRDGNIKKYNIRTINKDMIKFQEKMIDYFEKKIDKMAAEFIKINKIDFQIFI